MRVRSSTHLIIITPVDHLRVVSHNGWTSFQWIRTVIPLNEILRSVKSINNSFVVNEEQSRPLRFNWSERRTKETLCRSLIAIWKCFLQSIYSRERERERKREIKNKSIKIQFESYLTNHFLSSDIIVPASSKRKRKRRVIVTRPGHSLWSARPVARRKGVENWNQTKKDWNKAKR